MGFGRCYGLLGRCWWAASGFVYGWAAWGFVYGWAGVAAREGWVAIRLPLNLCTVLHVYVCGALA